MNDLNLMDLIENDHPLADPLPDDSALTSDPVRDQAQAEEFRQAAAAKTDGDPDRTLTVTVDFREEFNRRVAAAASAGSAHS